MDVQFVSGSVHVRFVVDKLALRQDFHLALPFFLAIVIPPMIHTHLHVLVALMKRIKERSLGSLRQALLFLKSGSI